MELRSCFLVSTSTSTSTSTSKNTCSGTNLKSLQPKYIKETSNDDDDILNLNVNEGKRNISVDFSRTIYVHCSECDAELSVTTPQETPNDWIMKIKPHICT